MCIRDSPWGGPSYEMLPFEELDRLVKSLQPDCMLMNIGCQEGLSGTDVVFYENAAGQEVDHSFNEMCIRDRLCPAPALFYFWRNWRYCHC